jgi:predicted component of type VI protein secretion system
MIQYIKRRPDGSVRQYHGLPSTLATHLTVIIMELIRQVEFFQLVYGLSGVGNSRLSYFIDVLQQRFLHVVHSIWKRCKGNKSRQILEMHSLHGQH